MYSLLMGIGLSSSTGYKPFIPLVIISISARLGFIELTEQSQWMGSIAFICIMVVLSILEFFSASIPVLGRVFDIIGLPVTIVCGYIALTSLTGNLVEDNIVMRHAVGLLLGGGSAGLVKAFNIIKNTLSDTVTFGLTSSVNSVLDAGKALLVSILALVAPIFVCILLVVFLFMTYLGIRKLARLRNGKIFKKPAGQKI